MVINTIDNINSCMSSFNIISNSFGSATIIAASTDTFISSKKHITPHCAVVVASPSCTNLRANFCLQTSIPNQFTSWQKSHGTLEASTPTKFKGLPELPRKSGASPRTPWRAFESAACPPPLCCRGRLGNPAENSIFSVLLDWSCAVLRLVMR